MGKRSRRDPDGHRQRGKRRSTPPRTSDGLVAGRPFRPFDSEPTLPPARQPYELPFQAHPSYQGDHPRRLPGGRSGVYSKSGIDCLGAATATVLDVPYEDVPKGGMRTEITGPERIFKVLADWAAWAEERGLVPCVHTARHEPPIDREWWIALVLRAYAGGVHFIHFNVYVMHHGRVVHSPLVNLDGVPSGPWYGLTLDQEYMSGFPLGEHLAEFSSAEEFLRPVIAAGIRRAGKGSAAA